MNNRNQHFYTTIESGEYIGRRLYDDCLTSLFDLMSTETYFMLEKLLKDNFKVFFFECDVNHNINIPQNDLDFLKLVLKTDEDSDQIRNYIFSKETLQIKNLQYLDFLNFYNTYCYNNNMIAFWSFPFLKNNLYCYNFMIVVRKDFDLNFLLKLNFNIIKINSVIQFFQNTLTLDFVQKYFNPDMLQFKEYYILPEDCEKFTPYDIFSLPEKIELDNCYEESIKLFRGYSNSDRSEINNKIEQAEQKLKQKTDKLFDYDLFKKVNLSKLCWHLHVYDYVIYEDNFFFLPQPTGSVQVKPADNDQGWEINKDSLYFSSLLDQYCYNDYQLFTIDFPIYNMRRLEKKKN